MDLGLKCVILVMNNKNQNSCGEIISGVLHTYDKVSIAYDHFKNGSESVVIVCHGFFNSRKNRWMQKTAEILTVAYDVILFDFRGHGDSSGKFYWTSKEHLDLQTVLDYATSNGYKHVGIIGFSLGAAVSVDVASKSSDIKSMVLVSCPISFWEINFHFWEPGMFADLKDNFECGWEDKGANVGNLFLPKKNPLKSISEIKDTSILLIHGKKDWIIKAYHSKTLYGAIKTNKKLELIKGGFHAELIIKYYPDRFKEIMLEWFSQTM